MELIKRKKNSIVGRCEQCGREIDIPYSNTTQPYMYAVELKSAVQCECGEYHNLLLDPTDKHKRRIPRDASSQADTSPKCPRCDSSRLTAGDKGFSPGKAAVGGLLIGYVGLLGGLLGSKKTIITCLNCGHKWQAGKRY
jgi:DNA-directed RNA polymerase subunit RPC12/RpoP